jgi:hypothetical protein
MAETVPAEPEPLDCPECGSAGSVFRDFCQICEAEFGELCGPESSDPASAMSAQCRRILHPSIPLRFSDVIRELQEIAAMASTAVDVEGTKLASACRRAESLLRVLRAQFLREVALDRPIGADHRASR